MPNPVDLTIPLHPSAKMRFLVPLGRADGWHLSIDVGSTRLILRSPSGSTWELLFEDILNSAAELGEGKS